MIAATSMAAQHGKGQPKPARARPTGANSENAIERNNWRGQRPFPPVSGWKFEDHLLLAVDPFPKIGDTREPVPTFPNPGDAREGATGLAFAAGPMGSAPELTYRLPSSRCPGVFRRNGKWETGSGGVRQGGIPSRFSPHEHPSHP